MRLFSLAAVAALASISSIAEAHISISSGPAFANKTQKITFAVGHGCEGADTIAVQVDLPAGVSSVRAMPSDFAKPALVKDGANAVTAILWTKPDADHQLEDFGYYEITLRARVADVPFTTLTWKITQTCKAADGTVLPPVVWDGADGAKLNVVPARVPGWNKVTLAAAVPAAGLPTFFGDAQIVWRGTAAYSANANTMAQIAGTTGVTALESDLAAGDEIWIKY
jgi:periplasmic copper chaperone A